MLIKEEPTPMSRRDGRDWQSIVDHLKSSPGEWFLVAEDLAPSTSSYLKKRYGVEARVRDISLDGLRAARLYARWPEHKAENKEHTPS